MTNDQKKKYLAQFHKFQLNREQHFAPKIFAALKFQQQQFLKSYKNSFNMRSALMDVSSHQLRSVLKTLYIDAGVHYGSLVYSQLPKAPKKIKRRAPFGFNEEMTDLINQWFELGWLNTAESITDSTRDLIQQVMKEAVEEGWSYDRIEQELTKESKDLTRNRSALIARTETVTATNQAAYFAAAKTGLMMKKEWLSANDDRVRMHHLQVNGSKVDMEGYFTVGTSRILLPGARVQENGLPTPAKEVCNCRCVVLYEAQRVNGRLVEFDYGVWNNVLAA